MSNSTANKSNAIIDATPTALSTEVSPTVLSTEAPTTEVKTAAQELAEALAAEEEMDAIEELAKVKARLADRKRKQAEFALEEEAKAIEGAESLALLQAAAHAESIRVKAENELKIAAIVEASKVIDPMLKTRIEAQVKADLDARIKSIEETTKVAIAASQVESAQELRAKKLLATRLAESNKGKAEIQEIVERGVLEVNRLQLRSASQETTVAAAMGVTRKMETVETTVNI